jgi:hypothetical protein
MRNSFSKPWAICTLVCAMIAMWPGTIVAQAPAIDAGSWGPYARLVGQTLHDENPSGFDLRWRWQTEGEVLLEEWYARANPDKPSHVMTIRLGSRSGTFNLKSSAMMGKEWEGTLLDDGSIDYVGKGLLKMRYSVRVDAAGAYVQADTRGNTYRYVAPANSSALPVVARMEAPPPSTTPPPSSPVPVASPPVQPPAPPIKAPRRLTEADLADIRASVRASRARAVEKARVAELQRQEAARQAAEMAQVWAAQEAQRQREEAIADAEFEEERARKAAAWQAQSRASEQALNDSLQRMRDDTAQIQAQQAEAAQRQRAQAEAAERAERLRQLDLVREANQRQADEAARLAAQRQQSQLERDRAQQQPARGTAEAPREARASTETDANRCVSRPELRQNDTFQGNTAAYVVNGCGVPVDVKICLMTESGWKCGATWGLAAQAGWSHSAFRATGGVFVDAKSAGSSRALASP